MNNIDIDVVTDLASRHAAALTRSLMVNYWLAHDDESGIKKWRNNYFKAFMTYLVQDAEDLSLRRAALSSAVETTLGLMDLSKTTSPKSTSEKDIELLEYCKHNLAPAQIVRSAEKITKDWKPIHQGVFSDAPAPSLKKTP